MNRRAFLAASACCGLASTSAQEFTPPSNVRRFGQAAAYSAVHDGVSFLVARNGIVLAEDYPNDGGVNTRWSLGAATRAFAPLLAASLIEDNLMSLDEPVAMTIGDWGAHPLKSMISIRVLLYGASGIAFPRRGPTDLFTAIALEPVAPPGERYIYDAAPYVLMVEIARRKLAAAGRPADPATYLTERTLLPIGCVPIGWTRGPDGAPRLDEGAAVSARSLAQVGELIRRDGVFRAQQLVDEAAMQQARLGSFAEARAGMGLFLGIGGRGEPPDVGTDLWRMSPPAPIDLAMAAGEGGQRLYIIPSESIVAVRQSRRLDARGFSDDAFLSLLSRDL